MLLRELDTAAHNFSVIVAEVAGELLEAVEGEAASGADSPVGGGEPGADSSDTYDRIMADVWVGAVLTLLIFSCICCVCSCLLYHKFRQWKNRGPGNAPRPSSGGLAASLLLISARCPPAATPYLPRCITDGTRLQARGMAETAHARATAAGATEGAGVPRPDAESLPSYTIVSGLPSYDEAIEQWRMAREGRRASNNNNNNNSQQQMAKLSVSDLFAAYKSYQMT